MANDETMRSALQRVAEVFRKRPEAARSTSDGTAVLEEGFGVVYTAGNHSVRADMPEVMGGGGSAPSPGFYARAGIATCVAVGLKLAAVRQGVSVGRILVRIETDFDDAALLGLGAASAAPLATRLRIKVESEAPEAEVRILIEGALAADPWYLALREAQQVDWTLEAT